MTPYRHLQGYLHRWTIARLGRAALRLHQILDKDRTPFLHSHPFWYVSLVLRGGYDERALRSDGSLRLVRRRFGSLVIRKPGTLHRIDRVVGQCTTLFLAWSVVTANEQGWRLMRHADVAAPAGYDDLPDGLYESPSGGFRRREDGMWFAKRPTRELALACDRISLHQARLE